MEDKNELSDIVLEKGGDKKANAKKMILLVALLIVVFLVVLIAMKLLNKPTDDSNKQALSLPPAPTTTTMQEPKPEPLFEQVPIKKEENNFEKVVQKLKEQENEPTTDMPTPPQPPVQEEVVKQETPKIEDVVKETIQKETVKTPTVQAKVSNNLYIQVGATLKDAPSEKFLKLIKDAGYTHTLYRIKVGDKTATKILVGPFKDRAEATEQMPTIKEKINKEAFFYRVKN